MTYLEAEKLYEYYIKTINEKTETQIKLFCFYNLETSLLAAKGSKNEIQKYVRDLKKEEKQEINMEDQFKDLNFG